MASNDEFEGSLPLYGPNFIAWKKRIDATLRLHDLATYTFHEDINDPQASLQHEWARTSSVVAKFISTQVDYELMRRISAHYRGNAQRLMARLEHYCVKLRFTGLPAELRDYIYANVVDSEGDFTIDVARRRSSAMPAITRASRLLRSESLKIFYKRTRFLFDFDGCSGMREPDDLFTNVHEWAARRYGANMKFMTAATVRFKARLARSKALRTLVFGLSYDLANDHLSMKLDYGDNLDVRLTAGSMKRFQTNCKVVEANRKALGMRGDAIMLAIIGDPSLWDSTLKVERVFDLATM